MQQRWTDAAADDLERIAGYFLTPTSVKKSRGILSGPGAAWTPSRGERLSRARVIKGFLKEEPKFGHDPGHFAGVLGRVETFLASLGALRS